MWRADDCVGIKAVVGLGIDLNDDGQIATGGPRKSFAQAAWQIVLADVSMSLDNVLAVAGAARKTYRQCW